MIKIGIIIDTIVVPTAGTEKQLLMLLNDLDRAKFSPHLICLQNSEWMQRQAFDFPVTILGIRKILSPKTFFKIRGLARLIKREQFDIVQTFFIDANIIGCAAAMFARSAALVSSRRNIGYWYDNKRLTLLRRLNRRVDWFIANSRAAVESTIEHENADRSKFRVIYNGLDLEKFESADRETAKKMRASWGFGEKHTVIGMVANLRPVKNIEALIRAAAEITKEFEQARFVVVGEGEPRASYEKLIGALGLTGKFVLPGSSNDIATVLTAFDRAVLCSSSESFSNSLIEYMAAGLPIVASAVGGNVEAITHGKTGLLYDVAQNTDLVSHLRTLILDPQSAEQMGRQARDEAFARFSRARSLSDHQAFYTEISSQK